MIRLMFNLFLIGILGFSIYGTIFGLNGIVYNQDITQKIQTQQKINNQLLLTKEHLTQRINSLKSGYFFAYESYIRRDLQFISKNELFFRIVNSAIHPAFAREEDLSKFEPAPNATPLDIKPDTFQKNSDDKNPVPQVPQMPSKPKPPLFGPGQTPPKQP